MSAPTANSQFSFELPNLSYVDARWEEPSLRSVRRPVPQRRGFGVFLADCIAAVIAWRRQQVALAELETMTNHELLDIGLTRADLRRLFDPAHNRDLVKRAA